jgi:phospholipase D1/2
MNDVSTQQFSDRSLLKPGQNCWRVERATYASMVVDCGNYYRDLHESIMKAKHSIFILGWDIDSRVRLVRGDHKKNADDPETLYALIVKKASENPDLQVYMNQWNNTVLFSSDREFLPALKWRKANLPNIHFRLDRVIPFHGSQHQKVIVIDDEVAYTGGMDIGIKRWDCRLHKPFNEHRCDPIKVTDEEPSGHYISNHDIQIVLAGGPAQALGELARKRWRMAADYDAIPLRPYQAQGIPNCWPDSDPPDFDNIEVGVAMTLPPLGEDPPVRQIEELYIDQIKRAEKFIYMENQYFAYDRIASTINQQLKNKPELRVLLFSSRDPQGTIEEVSMWRKRIRFRKIIERGDVRDRVALTYGISVGEKKVYPLHVHSKMMIVDDKFLHVGSANINSRSMMLDSECDVVLISYDEKSCAKIADIRNDLIREHSGMEKIDTQKLVEDGNPIDDFLKDVSYSTQHLRRARDVVDMGTGILGWLASFGEPKQPNLHPAMEVLSSYNDSISFPHKRVSTAFLLIMMCILFALFWRSTPVAELVTSAELSEHIQSWRNSAWAYPAVIALFVAAGFLFAPVTLLIAATAAAFGPVTGFYLALAGALVSAYITFLIGYFMGQNLFQNWTNTAFHKITSRIRNAGVMGVVTVRMVPLAPFTLVNMILGVTKVRALPFIMGTLLGLLPGALAMVILGDSLADFWRSPDMHSLLYVGIGLAVWLAALFLIHMLVGRDQAEYRKIHI